MNATYEGRPSLSRPRSWRAWAWTVGVLVASGAAGVVISRDPLRALHLVLGVVVITGIVWFFGSLVWDAVRGLVERNARVVGRRRAAGAPWREARGRFEALRAEYAAHECDPVAVLRVPALTDVRVESTARFVEAFAEAQALDTDQRPGAGHARSYVAAVEGACRAWQAAREAAERIRLAGLSPAERASVQRVIKLLTVAAYSGHEAERLTAYGKARVELGRLERAGVIQLPRAARAAVEEAARGQLPAAEPA